MASLKISQDMEKLQELIKDIQKFIETNKVLLSQFNENENVLQELNYLNEDNIVYKLIGSVMIKQDLSEAKEIVKNRLEYISSERKQIENQIQEHRKQEISLRDSITKYQSELQKA